MAVVISIDEAMDCVTRGMPFPQEENKRHQIDWESIEREYRAGILSLREIAELHQGTNHVAISRRAKKEGWTQDLSQKIKARANELVTRSVVTDAVTAERAVTARQIVETNAQAIVSVRLSHRADLIRGRSIVNSMLSELSLHCGQENVDLLEQLGDMMRSPDEYGNDKLNELYRKIIALPGRAKTMKDLAESLTKLIDKERQAFGLDNETSDADSKSTMTDTQRASRIAALLAKARTE